MLTKEEKPEIKALGVILYQFLTSLGEIKIIFKKKVCQSVIFGNWTLSWKFTLEFMEKVIFEKIESTMS